MFSLVLFNHVFSCSSWHTQMKNKMLLLYNNIFVNRIFNSIQPCTAISQQKQNIDRDAPSEPTRPRSPRSTAPLRHGSGPRTSGLRPASLPPVPGKEGGSTHNLDLGTLLCYGVPGTAAAYLLRISVRMLRNFVWYQYVYSLSIHMYMGSG